MNIIVKIIGYTISVPFRIKGVTLGKNSFIGFGYDFLFNSLRNIAIGDNVLIGSNAWFQTNNGGQIIIGDSTHIGRGATISSIKSITIGQKCLLSYDVSVIDHDHLTKRDSGPMTGDVSEGREVIIGDETFIGARSFILKGVNIGKYCVVGAGSVVTKSFPDNSIIAGNPARLIRTK